ncbi:MAG: SLBB domain-containing protein [Candidatus Latescibacterota bacterium]|nr:SLBB domain-containing protein [Candidatus Latescibacterota bacterium]
MRSTGTFWVTVAVTVCCLAIEIDAQAARVLPMPGEGEKGTSESSRIELPVGMEAYREVLLSGDYLVGPGDRFLIQMSAFGEPLERRVLNEGGLFIPRAGRVQIAGRSLREAKQAVEALFRERVHVGTINIELSEIRQFPISVVGTVNMPGIVQGSGVERVSELLQKAGGFAEGASRRNIYLVRSSELTELETTELRRGLVDESVIERLAGSARRVDISMFEVTGESALNPFVTDGDVIIVPPRADIVRAMEAVRRNDIFEYVRGDRLSHLALLAMGPAAHYDPDNVYIFRYVDEGRRQIRIRVDLDAAVKGVESEDIELESGDWLVVRSRPGYQQQATVRIIGEVEFPGFYVIDDGATTLLDVLDQSGGVTSLASLPKARITRQLEDDEQLDPEFERILTIPPAAWNEDEKQYFNMRSRTKRGQMVVDFVALFEDDPAAQANNILVRPGDVIVIPSSLRTVLVSGRAAFPGAVPYEPSFSVQDYIQRAGGFGWRASKGVRVIKARTGEVLEAADVQRIDPGDNIWIKEKPTRDYWTLFTQAMAVAGQVATVLILVGQ